MKHQAHQLTENVKFLHKVAIIRDRDAVKEALILKRASDSKSRPNCWDLPGGNVEWPAVGQASAGDLHQADVAREVMEEANLVLDEKIFDLAHLVYFSSYFDSEKEIYTIICGWWIDFTATNQAEIKISDEHQAQAWVSLAHLADYDFGGVKGEFIKQIIIEALKK